MRLNNLSPAPGSKKKGIRLGRGIGSTFGKTCGKGHKGLKARSGGTVRAGFEGGQMPIYKRLPKYGFKSRKQLVSQSLPVSALNRLEGEITFDVLLQHDLIKNTTQYVKFYASGEVTSKLQLKGLSLTKGAKNMIEKAGGKVE